MTTHYDRENLIDYLHGALEPEADAALFEHLETCPACRALHDEEAGLRRGAARRRAGRGAGVPLADQGPRLGRRPARAAVLARPPADRLGPAPGPAAGRRGRALRLSGRARSSATARSSRRASPPRTSSTSTTPKCRTTRSDRASRRPSTCRTARTRPPPPPPRLHRYRRRRHARRRRRWLALTASSRSRCSRWLGVCRPGRRRRAPRRRAAGRRAHPGHRRGQRAQARLVRRPDLDHPQRQAAGATPSSRRSSTARPTRAGAPTSPRNRSTASSSSAAAPSRGTSTTATGGSS